MSAHNGHHQPGRTVVLLGGRNQREFTVLHELGAKIIYLESEVPVRCIPWVDVPVDANLGDQQEILALVRSICAGRVPDGVLTHTEPHIPLMAYLADQLGIPRGLSPHAARNCHDKLRTRLILRTAGVPCPDGGLALTTSQALELAERLAPPVVVKPRGGAGGFRVRCCASIGEVADAASAILEATGSEDSLPGVLVEEYVPGTEYAVQAITRGGTTEILTVFTQHVSEPPVFVELGYDYPPVLPAQRYHKLSATVSNALSALGVREWISHTQVRDSPRGFQIIEVNARRPGGRLPEMTHVLSGIDMVRAASELALGQPVSTGQPQASHASYRSMVAERAGIMLYNPHLALDGLASAVPPIVELEIPPGDPVLPATHPRGGVYGRIVVFGDSPEAVKKDLRIIQENLRLEILDLGPIDLTADSREFKPCC